VPTIYQNVTEERIAAIHALTQRIRELDLSAVPALRLELNRLRNLGRDATGNPADPELIKSIDELFMAISRNITSPLNSRVNSMGETVVLDNKYS
jgi:hypothetical protein